MPINVFDQMLDVDDLTAASSLRWSQFAHSFERDGITAIVHSLTHQVVYLSTELPAPVIGGKSIASDVLSADIVRKLVSYGLLVSSEYDEQKVLDQIRNQFLSTPSYDIMYLLLTDACNLACKYCVIEGNMPCEHQPATMTQEIADKAITLFGQLTQRGGKRSATVIFYGGEPLLNKRVFLHAVERISRESKQGKLPAEMRLTLITNGTQIDDDVIRCCKQHKVGVSLSLDGPQPVHDANRVFASGEGTFEQVIAALKRCQEQGLFPAASCTISPANIEQLPDIADWLIQEGVTGMGFNLLMDLPHTHYSDQDYVARATQGIIDAYKLGRRHGLYEDRIMRKVNAFVNKRLHLVDCGGCGHQIAVTPTGLIGPCHIYMPTCKHFPTNVWDADGYDFFADDVFAEWVKRSPINMPECLTCPALGSCGGGCLYNAEAKRGTIWQPDPEFCVHSRMLLEWLVWELYDQELSHRASAQTVQQGGDER